MLELRDRHGAVQEQCVPAIPSNNAVCVCAERPVAGCSHPLLADHEGTPADPTPTFQLAPPAAPASTAASAVAPAPALGATPVRTVAKAHPLTPSRQAVLEEEDQVRFGASCSFLVCMHTGAAAARWCWRRTAGGVLVAAAVMVGAATAPRSWRAGGLVEQPSRRGVLVLCALLPFFRMSPLLSPHHPALPCTLLDYIVAEEEATEEEAMAQPFP